MAVLKVLVFCFLFACNAKGELDKTDRIQRIDSLVHSMQRPHRVNVDSVKSFQTIQIRQFGYDNSTNLAYIMITVPGSSQEYISYFHHDSLIKIYIVNGKNLDEEGYYVNNDSVFYQKNSPGALKDHKTFIKDQKISLRYYNDSVKPKLQLKKTL